MDRRSRSYGLLEVSGVSRGRSTSYTPLSDTAGLIEPSVLAMYVELELGTGTFSPKGTCPRMSLNASASWRLE